MKLDFQNQYHSPIIVYLGHFQFFTIMNKAAMNVLIHVFLDICTQFSLPTSKYAYM